MAKKAGSFTIVNGNLQIHVDLSRFHMQLSDAQYKLDEMVMAGMEPYMPMQSGNFIQLTKARSRAMAGTGEVCAGAPPYGRYLYYGKVMVDKKTGRGPMKLPDGPGGYKLRFHKGAELVATDRPLKYGRAEATPEWFETAKARHGKNWIFMVKKIAGGG